MDLELSHHGRGRRGSWFCSGARRVGVVGRAGAATATESPRPAGDPGDMGLIRITVQRGPVAQAPLEHFRKARQRFGFPILEEESSMQIHTSERPEAEHVIICADGELPAELLHRVGVAVDRRYLEPA